MLVALALDALPPADATSARRQPRRRLSTEQRVDPAARADRRVGRTRPGRAGHRRADRARADRARRRRDRRPRAGWPARARRARPPRARSSISAASSAASARSVSSSMTCSTSARAPDASMIRAAGRPARSSRAVAERSSRPLGVRGGSGVERERDEHRALALGEVVPGRLAGRLRVAEHAEQVVAQLERLAERQPERRSARPSSLGGGAGERGAEVQRPLDGVLRGLVAQHPHRLRRRRPRRAPAPSTSRNWPAITSLRRDVEERRAPARTRVGRQAAACAAARRTRTAAGRRAGSRRRRRTARGRRASRARGAARSNARCVAGRPRRVSEASMKSSCTSALACSSSSAAGAHAARASSSGRRRATAR